MTERASMFHHVSFLVYDQVTNNVLAEADTREAAEKELLNWPGCEILTLTETDTGVTAE